MFNILHKGYKWVKISIKNHQNSYHGKNHNHMGTEFVVFRNSVNTKQSW